MSLENIFTLPSEYNDLRQSVRALAEKEIAPFARAVDEEHRCPQEAHQAFVKSALFAAHVPTENGGDRRIGEVGKGFALAMDTLDHTRITIAESG